MAQDHNNCVSKGCNAVIPVGQLMCDTCSVAGARLTAAPAPVQGSNEVSMADKYPKYYKHIPKGATVLDVYGVCQMFPVDDATGCINHARKKLLVPGTRTGGKSFIDDIKEARDTLTRYLELMGQK